MVFNTTEITVCIKNSTEAKKFWTENMDSVIHGEQLIGPGVTRLETTSGYRIQTTIILFGRFRMEEAGPQVSTAHPSVIFICADTEEEHHHLLSSDITIDDIQKYPYGGTFSFYDQGHQVYLLRGT